ncbi:MAG: hypothetical protein Q9182_006997 [Xanthomendoza sp. 2 TL-2023]
MATELKLDRINAGLVEMTENVKRLREMDNALKERDVAVTTREMMAAAQEQILFEREQSLKAREKDSKSAIKELVIQARAILTQYGSKLQSMDKQQLPTDSKSFEYVDHLSTEHTTTGEKGLQHRYIQSQPQALNIEECTDEILKPEPLKDPGGPTIDAPRLAEHSSTSKKVTEQPIRPTSKLAGTLQLPEIGDAHCGQAGTDFCTSPKLGPVTTPTMEASTSISVGAKRKSIPSSATNDLDREPRRKRAKVDTSSTVPQSHH